jgi:hypothetical protein
VKHTGPLSTFHDIFGGTDLRYMKPTAIASSVWTLVGTASPRYETWQGCAGCVNVDQWTNPVIAMGPFDGTPYATFSLYPPPAAPDTVEQFGASLAIHGNRIVVGSTQILGNVTIPPYIASGWVPVFGGRVHLYLDDNIPFVHERTIEYGGLNERFGHSVALVSDTLLVGRPGATPGAADLFDPNSGNHIATLTSPASGNKFGEAVALLDDLALVGAKGSGSVYVYRHDGNGSWLAAGTLASPGASSEFGAAIAVDNGRILVGAPAIDRAYVFEDDGDADWPVIAEIAGGAGSRLGEAVALTGDTAFLGAPQVLFPSNKRLGLVVRHERAPDGTWPYVSAKGSRKPTNDDRYGYLVSASSTLLSVAQRNVWTASSAHESSNPSEIYSYSAQTDIWDSDGDTVSNYGDNCVDTYNPGQEDADGDDIGNACELPSGC